MYLRPRHEQHEVLRLGVMWDLHDHQKRVHSLRVWSQVQFRAVRGTEIQPLNMKNALTRGVR